MNNKFTKPEIEFLNFLCETQEFDSYHTRNDGDNTHTTTGTLPAFLDDDIPN